MQGFSRPRTTSTLGGGDLTHLRKSVIWSSPYQHSTIRRGALQERLEELLVLELHKDGGRAFLNFTVRGLYKHVLAAITSKISGKRERDEVNVMIQKKGGPRKGGPRKGGPRKGTMGEKMASPVVLGALSAHLEASESEDHTGTPRNDEPEEEDEEEESLATAGTTPAPAPTVADPTATITDDSAPDDAPPPELPQRDRDLKPVSSYTHRVIGHPTDQVTYRERLGGYLYVQTSIVCV